MAKITRNRIDPATDTDTHKIHGRGGLGAGDDADVEGVVVVADRLTFGAKLIDNGGSGELRSSWTSCADSSIVRISVYYRASTPDREVLVVFRDTADVLCAGSGVFTPENSGVETVAASGLYIGTHWFVFDARGMKDFMVIVKAGTPNVDVYGAAA